MINTHKYKIWAILIGHTKYSGVYISVCVCHPILHLGACLPLLLPQKQNVCALSQIFIVKLIQRSLGCPYLLLARSALNIKQKKCRKNPFLA